MEEKKVIKIRKPNSVPLYGRVICVPVSAEEIKTASGINLVTSVNNNDMIVVAVSEQSEIKKIEIGSKVIPFAPPTYDGGRTRLEFQMIVEFDEKGRHEYVVCYESELASYIPKEHLTYCVEIINSKDFVKEAVSPISKPRVPGIIIPDHIKKDKN